MRFKNHPQFSHKILAIHRLLRLRLALYDGSYFLNKTGPMIGEPVRTDLLIGPTDIGAGDFVCCQIMGVEPKNVGHLRLAQREGLMPATANAFVVNQPVSPFASRRFSLKRTPINYLALAAFHSSFGTRLFYDSSLAGPVHTLLYAIRRNPLVGRLLYGRIGPPEAKGRRS
jgi:hypothetical protein